MWAKGHVPDRPWWSRHDLTYRRCDGITILSRAFMDITHGDERGLWDGKEPYADAMARIDAAHPLPAPPPMPGQVWAYPDGAEVCLIGVDVPPEMPPDAWGRARFSPRMWHEKGNDVWPPPGAILVAGPTPWGRDIPWSPA
jgi:hypothetical protein